MMKIPIMLIGCLVLVGSAPARVAAGDLERVEIRQIEDFFEPLSQQGAWVNMRVFGWCWYPTGVETDWRPYRHGRWVQTQDGPYWDSDEPWAWATYHYGRWFWDSERGWLWKPDLAWAPAWVDWREGDDVIGWAPLPPRGYSAGSYGVYTAEPYIAPSSYVFVEYHTFWRPIYPSFVFYWDSWHHHHHRRYYDCTKRVTKIKHADTVIINGTPKRVNIKERKDSQSVKVVTTSQSPATVTTTRPARQANDDRRRIWSRALEAQTPRSRTPSEPAVSQRATPPDRDPRPPVSYTERVRRQPTASPGVSSRFADVPRGRVQRQQRAEIKQLQKDYRRSGDNAVTRSSGAYVTQARERDGRASSELIDAFKKR